MEEELYSLAEDWRVRKIFEYLRGKNYASLDELYKKLGISKTALIKRVREMCDLGIIEIKRAIELYEERLKWHPSKIFVSLREGEEKRQFEKVLVNKIKQENHRFYT